MVPRFESQTTGPHATKHVLILHDFTYWKNLLGWALPKPGARHNGSSAARWPDLHFVLENLEVLLGTWRIILGQDGRKWWSDHPLFIKTINFGHLEGEWNPFGGLVNHGFFKPLASVLGPDPPSSQYSTPTGDTCGCLWRATHGAASFPKLSVLPPAKNDSNVKRHPIWRFYESFIQYTVYMYTFWVAFT